MNPIHTLGGIQNLLMLSEQGLYFFLGRSDKPKALPFQMWLAGEVLPAIRKHGRYEDASGKMGTLLDGAIGVSELTALNGVIRQKAAIVRKDRRRSFIHTMHSRLHTRFNVPRTELILAKDFEAACNFVAAYALDGEFLPKQEESGIKLTDSQAITLNHLVHHIAWVAHYWNAGIGQAAQSMDSPMFPGLHGHLRDCELHRSALDSSVIPEIKAMLAGKLPAGSSLGLRPAGMGVAA